MSQADEWITKWKTRLPEVDIVRRILGLLACLLLLGIAATNSIAGERRLPAKPPFAQSIKSSAAAATAFQQLRKTAGESGKVRIIVELRVPYAAEGKLSGQEARRQRSDIAGARSSVLAKLALRGDARIRTFDALPLVAMDVTLDDLDRLASDANVLGVQEDRINKAMLAESVPLIGGTAAWSAGYRGLGQTVAVIDMGVDKNHPFLFGKVVSEACYSIGRWCPGGATSSTAPGSGRPCPGAGCDHGTHVAGIVAGQGMKFSGVAKDANIIAIQVFGPNGKEPGVYDSDVIRGLERVYALRNSFTIAAVNLSLGSKVLYPEYCDDQKKAMKLAIDNLASAGIATVVASGNSYSSNGISSPACISSAVSVGAVSDSAWGTCFDGPSAVDKVACYSNSSDVLSLLAPGSFITSSVPYGKFAGKHGTSMAAPHVAGAWAIIKEKAPNATVDDVLTALQTTGKGVTDYRSGITVPRINVAAALTQFSDGRRAISYVKAGPAQGLVSFSPAGSVPDCRKDCVNRFAPGTSVTLTATPAPGVTFFGWGGDCSGLGSCTVTVSKQLNVVAGFYTGSLVPLTYTKAGAGSGSVDFAVSGVTASCTDTCTRSYWKNATVMLSAQPDPGSYFKGWSGTCRGPKTHCSVRLGRGKNVTAVFEKLPSIAASTSK